jgi:hypothetical protein
LRQAQLVEVGAALAGHGVTVCYAAEREATETAASIGRDVFARATWT